MSLISSYLISEKSPDCAICFSSSVFVVRTDCVRQVNGVGLFGGSATRGCLNTTSTQETVLIDLIKLPSPLDCRRASTNLTVDLAE